MEFATAGPKLSPPPMPTTGMVSFDVLVDVSHVASCFRSEHRVNVRVHVRHGIRDRGSEAVPAAHADHRYGELRRVGRRVPRRVLLHRPVVVVAGLALSGAGIRSEE